GRPGEDRQRIAAPDSPSAPIAHTREYRTASLRYWAPCTQMTARGAARQPPLPGPVRRRKETVTRHENREAVGTVRPPPLRRERRPGGPSAPCAAARPAHRARPGRGR